VILNSALGLRQMKLGTWKVFLNDVGVISLIEVVLFCPIISVFSDFNVKLMLIFHPPPSMSTSYVVSPMQLWEGNFFANLHALGEKSSDVDKHVVYPWLIVGGK